MEYQLSDFKLIKHFIFDIDGVLTDGNFIIDSDGNLLRSMNIKDGYAMQLAIKKGFTISIISGAKGEGLQKRFTGLGIDSVHLGISQKTEVFSELVKKDYLTIQHTLYMGDDMPDLQVMKEVYFPCCPADACNEIKQVSKYISPYEGGQGCVRDVIEKVLKLNDCWE